MTSRAVRVTPAGTILRKEKMTSEIHAKLVELSDAHKAADEYQAGHYDWTGGACAIGCTIRDARKLKILPKNTASDNHEALEALGVPELAWRLCDLIFEGLPQDGRSAWPPRFLRAIVPGADYANLPARIMARCARKLSEDAIDPVVRRNCAEVADLWERRAQGNDPSKEEWDAAQQQAAAARQQADAARQQADAAWHQADAAQQQAYAAWQQADAARQQADAARQQGDAARQQAYAARQQAYAGFWPWCADMLCEELAK